MDKVKVLIEGYAQPLENGWVASSTVSFIQANGKNIIVDPGCNRQKLLCALQKEKLRPQDIDYVFLTHTHTDHSLLAGIFEQARVLTGTEIYDNDRQTENEGFIPGTDVRIIETPGHSPDSYSLIVKTDEGICIVCGDVFWWSGDEDQVVDLEKEDPYAEETMDTLIRSRRQVLEMADFVIPGHGGVFKAR